MRYSRQNKIIEIISNNDVDTQERLSELLKAAGFEVTQATISRDIKDLQLVKVLTQDGKYKYSINGLGDFPLADRYNKIFREAVLSIKAFDNMVVIRTIDGCAGAVAAAVDSMGLEQVMGSVAGMNTVFLAAGSGESVKQIQGLLLERI